jgi:ribose transport system substrate-binding protein
MRPIHGTSLSFLLIFFVGCGKQEPAKNGGGGDSAHSYATNQVASGTDLVPGTQPAGVSARTCTRSGPPVTGPLKIAVIPMGTTHEFWKSIHAGALRAEAELKDVQILWKGPLRESDRTEQINIVENFINAGVSGIALAAVDDVALIRPIREATKAGIGVVIMDSAVKADVCTDYASFVATDSYVGGCKGAQRLGEILNGKGKVILLRYEVGSASAAQREQGFLDTIKRKFPNIELISTEERGGDTTEVSFAKAENLLNRFKEVEGIFTPNESTTFGMLRAIQQAGIAGKVKFVGFDASEKLVQALAQNQIQGLVVQNPMRIGHDAVSTLVAYLRGEPVPQRIDTGSVVATPENMNEPKMKELLRPPIDRYLK